MWSQERVAIAVEAAVNGNEAATLTQLAEKHGLEVIVAVCCEHRLLARASTEEHIAVLDWMAANGAAELEHCRTGSLSGSLSAVQHAVVCNKRGSLEWFRLHYEKKGLPPEIFAGDCCAQNSRAIRQAAALGHIDAIHWLAVHGIMTLEVCRQHNPIQRGNSLVHAAEYLRMLMWFAEHYTSRLGQQPIDFANDCLTDNCLIVERADTDTLEWLVSYCLKAGMTKDDFCARLAKNFNLLHYKLSANDLQAANWLMKYGQVSAEACAKLLRSIPVPTYSDKVLRWMVWRGVDYAEFRRIDFRCAELWLDERKKIPRGPTR